MSLQKEKIKEFSRQGAKELQNLLKSKKERLRQLRFDLAAGKVKNVREVRGTKKDIARIETVLKLKSEDPSRAEPRDKKLTKPEETKAGVK